MASLPQGALGVPHSEYRLLYSAAQIERYFGHGNGAEQMAHFARLIEATNAFLAEHPAMAWVPAKAGQRASPEPCSTSRMRPSSRSTPSLRCLWPTTGGDGGHHVLRTRQFRWSARNHRGFVDVR